MATKTVNIITAGLIGFSVLFLIGTLLVTFDDLTGNTNRIGDEAIALGGQGVEDYQDTEVLLQGVTYNTTSVVNIEDFQFIDPRGVTESSIVTRNSPSSMVDAISGLGGKFLLHPVVLGVIIALIVITSLFIFIRAILGESKV